MSLESIRHLVEQDFEKVNQLILKNISSNVGLAEDLCHHIIDSGGKRLRPLILLLAAKACDYHGDLHVEYAAAVEYFHTATLLHDDVIDESSLRRGKETANEIWGAKASILVGDYLFTQSFILMVKCMRIDILNLLANASHQITLGEIKQLNNRFQCNASLENYFDIIHSKTSVLFATAAEIGAKIATEEQSIIDALRQYGEHLGNAFQLVDDALDYCAEVETLGKNIGDDLADGKATLPLLHALENTTEEKKIVIKKSLQQGSLENLDLILAAIEETKAIDYTLEVANEQADKAITSLHPIPNNQYKQALIDLAQFSVARNR